MRGLAAAGISSSVGNRRVAYDNELAETINVLNKPEVIHRFRPWKDPEDVEYAPLEWVSWHNPQHRMKRLSNVPPTDYEEQY